jgi:putative flippase GtrA
VTTGSRVLRFSAVSALGVAVQLATLEVLIRAAGVGVLAATAAAVGAAVVHNFAWHRSWTWSDRPASSFAGRFAAFACSNGAVSLAGNLLVMAVLAGAAGVDPLPANLVAVGACGLVNFWIGDRLVFQASVPDPDHHFPTLAVRPGEVRHGAMVIHPPRSGWPARSRR